MNQPNSHLFRAASTIDCAVFPATFLCNSASVGRRWIRVCQNSFVCCARSFSRESSSYLSDTIGGRGHTHQLICLRRGLTKCFMRDRGITQTAELYRPITSAQLTTNVLTNYIVYIYFRVQVCGAKYEYGYGLYQVWSKSANERLEPSNGALHTESDRPRR